VLGRSKTLALPRQKKTSVMDSRLLDEANTLQTGSKQFSKLTLSRTPRQLESSPSSQFDNTIFGDDLDPEYSLRSSSSPSHNTSRRDSFPSVFPQIETRTVSALGHSESQLVKFDTAIEGKRATPAPPAQSTPRRRTGSITRLFSTASETSSKSASSKCDPPSSPSLIRSADDREKSKTPRTLPELKTDVEPVSPSLLERSPLEKNRTYLRPLHTKMDLYEDNTLLLSDKNRKEVPRKPKKKRINLKRRPHFVSAGSKAKELLGIGGKIERRTSDTSAGGLSLNSILDGVSIIDETLSEPVSSATNTDDGSGTNIIVTLIVGGKKYQTTKNTLKKHPRFLKGLYSNEFGTKLEEPPETYFIDRDPVLFVHIMRWLRDAAVHPDLKDLLLYKQLEREASYFCLNNMVVKIKAMISQLERNADENVTEYQQRLVMFVREDKLDETWSNWVLNWGYNFVSWVEASNPKNPELHKKSGARMSIMLNRGGETKKDKDWNYYHLVFQKRLSDAQVKVLQRIDNM